MRVPIIDRQKIEKAIIGRVMTYNDYSQVSSILSPKNFSKAGATPHSQIWEAIVSLYPLTKPTVWEVYKALLTAGHKADPHYLCECTITEAMVGSLPELASILLELDMREKYGIEIARVLTRLLQEENLKHYSDLRQLQEELEDHNQDVFDVLERVASLSLSQNFRSAMLDSFNRTIGRKVQEMRDWEELDTLISHIESLSRAPHQQTDAIVIMCRIIQRLFFHEARLDPTQIKQLTEMYKHLL